MLSINLRLDLPSGLFPSGSLTNNLHTFPFYPIRATCPAHRILLVILTKSHEILSKNSEVMCNISRSDLRALDLEMNR
jgi:hypothetical protein